MQFVASKKTAIVFSYLSVVLSAVSNLVLVPVYLKVLGADSYGLYQYIYAIAQYAMILDFGIASIMIKYISIYRVHNEIKKQENFCAHALLIVFIAILIIILIGIGFFLNIHHIMINRTAGEVHLAKSVFVFMILRVMIAIIQHFYDGILMAYDQYTISKGLSFCRVLFRLFFIIIMVLTQKSIYGIVLGDLFASLLCLVWSRIAVKLMTKYRAKWYYLDKPLLREAMVLVLALMLQSVVTYANIAVDKYIIGSFLTNTAVALYSIALLVEEMFVNLTTTVNSVFMPSITRIMASGVSNEELVDNAIRIGRLQCIICLGILCGFVVFGKQFIILWSGEDTVQVWGLGLLLMCGALLPLLQSTCITILTVKNKRMFRSIVLICVTTINMILSLMLIKPLGVYGVAIGTFISLILGNGIVMNVYYLRVLKLDVFRMLRGILAGIVNSAIVATIISIPLRIVAKSVLGLGLAIVAFCMVYCGALWIIGLRINEKYIIVNMFKKRGVHHA